MLNLVLQSGLDRRLPRSATIWIVRMRNVTPSTVPAARTDRPAHAVMHATRYAPQTSRMTQMKLLNSSGSWSARRDVTRYYGINERYSVLLHSVPVSRAA